MRTRQVVSIIALTLIVAMSWVAQTPDHGVIAAVCMTGMLVIYSLPDEDGRR